MHRFVVLTEKIKLQYRHIQKISKKVIIWLNFSMLISQKSSLCLFLILIADISGYLNIYMMYQGTGG